MWDGNKGDSSDAPMAIWTGYPQYYLTRDLFVGNVTDAKGIHRNSLTISTKVVEKKPDGNTISLNHFAISNCTLISIGSKRVVPRKSFQFFS